MSLFLLFSCQGITDKVKVEKICLKGTNKCLYLKRKTRGLNYAIVAIDNSSSRNFDHTSKDILTCNGLFDDLLYQIDNDTLFIYTYYSWNGDLKKPIIPVVLIDTFDNPEYMQFKIDADSLGIKKF